MILDYEIVKNLDLEEIKELIEKASEHHSDLQDEYESNNAAYYFFESISRLTGKINPYVLIPLDTHIERLKVVENYIRYCENRLHNWDNYRHLKNEVKPKNVKFSHKNLLKR